MRLNKFIARSGVASRRKADELIFAGEVKVAGEICKNPAMNISDETPEAVEVFGEEVNLAGELTYLMLNKPTGFLVTASDERGRKTVFDLLPQFDARLFPVGRLDRDTSGLLILTDDGDYAYSLTHPKHGLSKTYEALVSGKVSVKEIAALERGVRIFDKKTGEDFLTSPAKAKIIESGSKENKSLVQLTISEGKNRQVRRMLAAVGHEVIALKRIGVGDLKLGDLKEGEWRRFRPMQMIQLLHGK
jgi:23S rRNA pseudouridine2605 synthase